MRARARVGAGRWWASVGSPGAVLGVASWWLRAACVEQRGRGRVSGRGEGSGGAWEERERAGWRLGRPEGGASWGCWAWWAD
jgi:hypothetical protein